MKFDVVLKRIFPGGNEDVAFLVFVDEADCYDKIGDEGEISFELMKQLAVEYAIAKFFKQGYTLSVGDTINVLELSKSRWEERRINL